MAALFVFVAFVLAFFGHPQLSAVARVQFVPALLSALQGSALGIAILVALVLLTVLFGRVYCSWICPLGMMQDFAYRVAHPRRPKRARFTPNRRWLRLAVGLLCFGVLAAGCVGALHYADPYSIAARAVGAVAEPTRYGAWALAVIVVSVALPLGLAAWRGRLYCNTLCPVGAVLGLLAHRAPLAPHIDRSSCIRCAGCMKSCKAHAIDLKTMTVDKSRCVACYDCVSACGNHAMRLRALFAPKSPEQVDPGRRAVLGLGLFGLLSAALPARAEELATAGQGTAPAAVPPGAGSVEHLLSSCTGCGLCISNCPTRVLRPSMLALGVRGFMKPYMAYGEAACDYGCHTCSSVCPEGALTPLSLAEKQHTRIGLVHYDKRRCIPWQCGQHCGFCAMDCPTGALTLKQVQIPRWKPDTCTGCGRCARTCPHGAITMQEEAGRRHPVFDYTKCVGCGYCAEACRRHHAITPDKLEVPQVNEARCIGCGACEKACPATPDKAMTVTPLAQHQRTE